MNDLSEGIIREYLNETNKIYSIDIYEKLDSTNRLGKEINLLSTEQVHVIIANEQMLGRGRLGREWSSRAGEDIYISIIVNPNIDWNKISMVTIVVAMAVHKCLSEITDNQQDIQIKWPNDILYKNKKIGGILCEVSKVKEKNRNIVIGIGLNINRSFFECGLENATSLNIETKKRYNRDKIIGTLLQELEKYIDKFIIDGDLIVIKEEYNKYLVHYNKDIMIKDDRIYLARSLGINENGELIVNEEGGTGLKKISFGEVSIRGRDGYI